MTTICPFPKPLPSVSREKKYEENPFFILPAVCPFTVLLLYCSQTLSKFEAGEIVYKHCDLYLKL